MRPSAFCLIVSALLLAGSVSRGNFTVTAVANGAQVNGRQRLDLIAFNDGIRGTGTKLQAVDLTYTSPTQSKIYFGLQDLLPTDGDGNPTPDGTYDSVDLYNNPSNQPFTSQFRFSSAPGATSLSNPPESSHSYLAASPSTASVGSGTPYANGLSAFHLSQFALGSVAPIANGTGGGATSGASFGRLYVDAGGVYLINGFVAGDTGKGIPFTISNDPVLAADRGHIAIVAPPPQTLTVGKVVSNGVDFSVTVYVADNNATDPLSFALGTLPAGIQHISVSQNVGVPTYIVVYGALAYSTNQSTVTIPFTVSNGFGSATSSIVLNVVPEPAVSSVALAAMACIVRRCRR